MISSTRGELSAGFKLGEVKTAKNDETFPSPSVSSDTSGDFENGQKLPRNRWTGWGVGWEERNKRRIRQTVFWHERSRINLCRRCDWTASLFAQSSELFQYANQTGLSINNYYRRCYRYYCKSHRRLPFTIVLFRDRGETS